MSKILSIEQNRQEKKELLEKKIVGKKSKIGSALIQAMYDEKAPVELISQLQLMHMVCLFNDIYSK